MNTYYNVDVDVGYVKFTDNKILKTEPISKNMYIDLYKNDKPVGVEVVGVKNNVIHDNVERKIENIFSDLESDKFKKSLKMSDMVK
ncbi:MAG: DUF2283 domain-containing protein [Candidatus Nitrosocosmicus sp.]|jgi:uncharacterized protein YuzE